MTTTAVATEQLYYRDGREFTGRAGLDDNGKPFIEVQGRCNRCGGAGGADKWKPTGWTCFDCQGSGKGRLIVSKLYTAAQLAKLDASQAKRQAAADAKRNAAAAVAQAAADVRREAFEVEHAALFARVAGLDDAVVKDIVSRTRDRAFISPNQIALLVSLAERHEAHAKAVVASGYVGQVGERIEVAVTVKSIRSYDRPARPYGEETVWVITLVDAAGNQLLAKSPTAKHALSVDGEDRVAEGDALVVRGTVKEHSEYRGVKQTVLQRVKRGA